jgi:hypothetical protein
MVEDPKNRRQDRQPHLLPLRVPASKAVFAIS